MIPFDLLEGAVQGTRVEWIVLGALLPLAGWTAARSWGPAGALAGQRALLLIALDLAYALLLAWPVHAGALLVATLPVAGAAASRAPASLRGSPLAWLGALALAAPAVAANHLPPAALAVAWFLALFGAATLRGAVEPALPALKAWAAGWRAASQDDAPDDHEPSVK
ncbi:MAG TPA: hypothetical protein VHH36_07710 [Candidatus Thermoplasmatota archaeon]|nr:hypothetical protein [Candidatus Thermoplasmatota archaeon]